MQRNIGVRGMSIPTKETFDDITGTAAIKLLEVSRTWVNVVEYAEVNRGGVGIIILNYGNRRAADTFRELVVQQSTDEVTYQTYPTGDMMRKYAITAFIHAGLNKLPSAKIGPTIKLCNPDIKGSFTVVDCRTLREAGKEGCRVISIEGSPEFLEYLASTPKNHQFRILYKKIYINGGKRVDSSSNNSAPLLTHAATTQLVKGVNELIMKSAQKQYANMRAHPDARYVIHTKKTLIYTLTYYLATLTYKKTRLFFPFSGRKPDQNTGGTGGTPNEGTTPRLKTLTYSQGRWRE